MSRGYFNEESTFFSSAQGDDLFLSVTGYEGDDHIAIVAAVASDEDVTIYVGRDNIDHLDAFIAALQAARVWLQTSQTDESSTQSTPVEGSENG